jgi:hypothetical protein
VRCCRWVAAAAGNKGGAQGEESSEKSTPRVQLQAEKSQQQRPPVRSEVTLQNSWDLHAFDEDLGKINSATN